MSHLLTTPRTVLVAGVADGTVETIRDTVARGLAESVAAVDCDPVDGERNQNTTDGRTGGTLGDLLDSRDDVACVLVGDEAGCDPVSTCERIRERDELVPVVATPRDGDESLAYRFLAAGGDEYVPRSAGETALLETVDDAIESYEQRRDEHANSEMFESLLATVALPLYAKDEDGRYVRQSVVPAGKDPDEVIGKTDPEVYEEDPETVQGWLEDDLSVVETGEGIFDKEECYETYGGEYWSRTTKVPWEQDGEVVGLVGLSFNVTEYAEHRYRLEEYKERFEKFAESISHDLRNPLQVAAGNVELAGETGDDEALERADDALDRMSEMLGDLSDIATEEERTLSRSRMVDRSYETIELSPNTLGDLIADVWSVLDTDGATLDNDLPDESLIYGPESALRTVVENLLKNAVRHAGPGANVRVGHVPDGGFYVEDDGPGIDDDIREEIFADGFTTAVEGSGTGLAIVADITDSQNWQVDVADGPMGGARFEIHNCLFVRSDRLHEPTGPSIELDAADPVGEFDVRGSATYDDENDVWTVVGGGTNIWRMTNEFYYVHTTVEGPVSIRGRVADVEEVGDYSKAGFMVRDSLDVDATYGHVGLIPDSRTEVLWRTRTGEEGVSQFVERTDDAKPWFRVDRVGERVRVAISDDGEEWTPVNERRVELEDPVHVGMVVCSYRPNTACTGVFESVEVQRLDPE